MMKNYIMKFALATAMLIPVAGIAAEVGDVVKINDLLQGRVLRVESTNCYVEVMASSGVHLDGEVTIPYMVTSGDDTYIVVGIAENAFINSAISSVSIPVSVTYVGDYAFRGCSKLSSVTFPAGAGVETVGNHSFEFTYSLRSLNLDKVETVGEFAFCRSNLTEVSMPVVREIKGAAFQECQELSRIDTGDYLESIGNIAFSRCPKLASVNLGDPLKTMGSQVFLDCPALKEMVLPRSLMRVGKDAFSGCGLERVFIVTFQAKTFIDECGILSNKSIKRIYAHTAIADDIRKYLSEGGEIHPAESLASVEVQTLDEVVRVENLPGEVTTFRLVPQIEGVSDIRLFTFKGGVELFPEDGVYSVAAERAYIMYNVDSNRLDYFTNIGKPILSVETPVADGESVAVYSLQGVYMGNQLPVESGLYLVRDESGAHLRLIR